MNGTVERVKQGFRDRISDGAIYRFWHYGVDWEDVQCMAGPWRSKAGYNCTSVYNDIFGDMVTEGYSCYPIGGTGDFNSALGMGSWQFYEPPVIEKNYPPGTFCVTPYASDAVQGHNQMVSTPAVPAGGGWGDQTIMQSDVTKGVSSDGYWGWPGPNEDYTMAWTWNNIDWPTWVGLLPGIPILDGFPGYDATALEVIQWYIDLCKWWNDMPPIIPLNCVATELTSVLDKDRQVSIWDIPGYSTAVDHDSYGQHQQRAQYYPFPWNFEAAAWSFMAAVDRELGGDPYPDPNDDWAVAQLIQQVQRSFADGSDGKPVGWNYHDKYEWTMALVEEAGGEEPTPAPETKKPADTVTIEDLSKRVDALDKSLKDLSKRVDALDKPGVDKRRPQPSRKKRGTPQMNQPPERTGTGRSGKPRGERPSPLDPREGLQKAIEELSKRIEALDTSGVNDRNE